MLIRGGNSHSTPNGPIGQMIFVDSYSSSYCSSGLEIDIVRKKVQFTDCDGTHSLTTRRLPTDRCCLLPHFCGTPSVLSTQSNAEIFVLLLTVWKGVMWATTPDGIGRCAIRLLYCIIRKSQYLLSWKLTIRPTQVALSAGFRWKAYRVTFEVMFCAAMLK